MNTVAAGAPANRTGALGNFIDISHPEKNSALLVSGVLAAVGLVGCGIWLRWENLVFTIQFSNLASLLAPLVFAAAVIERAVEILVSPWRDAGASKLESAVAAVKARTPDPAMAAQNAMDLKTVSDTLNEYRGQTQKYAFAVSLTLSMLAGVVGVRALGPFLDGARFHLVSHAQQISFLCLDVALSAALLAGGADGIHSVVNAVTSFFDASAQKASS
ncbi:MAG: hypothetical protein WCF26_16340 [Candidatus Sulfotelmatobacter sp.]